TRALVTSLVLNSSRMYGWVWTWSSQMPRPQKRQVPTAVRLQCQQSILRYPPWFVRSMLPRSFLRHGRIEGALAERVRHHAIESLAVQTERTHAGAGHDRGRSGHVQQKRYLPE